MPLVNRIVVLLTPVFAAASAVGLAWVARHFPGLPLPTSGQVTALEIVGATAAGAAALKWLHGHQQWERLTQEGINFAAMGWQDVEKILDEKPPPAINATPEVPASEQKPSIDAGIAGEIAELEQRLTNLKQHVTAQPAAASRPSPFDQTPITPAPVEGTVPSASQTA